jgi:ubiquinone/menaquinone biosynthesis C-methylase UbiE
MDPWKGRFNAEVYDRFVRERRIYQELNKHLVELARVEDARRILDLACGTGATALECLKHMPADAELVGVDASDDMIAVARANTQDPRAEFLVAPAASVGEVVTAPFDRVVCNASFWQFPAARPVLDALSHLVEPNGRFVFNVPAERVLGEAAPVHAFQAALARALEERTGGALVAATAMLDVERLAEEAVEAGFEMSGQERFVYRGEQGELADLMSIPAMLGPLAPDLHRDERESALQDARGRVDLHQTVEVPWIYLLLERRS